MRFLVFGLFFCRSLFAVEKMVATGEVFDRDGKAKKFSYERYQNVEGDKVFDRAVYKSLEGDVLTEEKMETINDQLIRYDIDQKQLKQIAWIEVADKQVTFNLKKIKKNNYPQAIKKPENFIVGLQIVPFVKAHWDHFLKGEDKEVKLGVWNRQEAITFKLNKENGEADQLVIKMNPTSMFIRAVVDPIYFTFDLKSKMLIEYKGRTTPKEKRGNDFHDYDGITRYKSL